MIKILDCKQVDRAAIFQRGNLSDTIEVEKSVAGNSCRCARAWRRSGVSTTLHSLTARGSTRLR